MYIYVFIANEVDGEDFFGLEMQDVLQMIPRLKLRKKFISIWSEVTQQVFEIQKG